MPFRRSIWELDQRYAISPDLVGKMDLSLIARLQSIEAAKKRTPPAPLAQLAQIAERITKVPDLQTLTPLQFAEFLGRLLVYGIGIKTAICMLAVISKGAFPPMDEQVASGLLALGIVGPDEARMLNGTNVQRFSKVYVTRVLPAWTARRAEGISARDLDQQWAAAGKQKAQLRAAGDAQAARP
jgi:hypothetical protein